MAIVAPAQTPNGTGPNHIITGSGPSCITPEFRERARIGFEILKPLEA
jgi:hypothetical protein